MAELIKPKEITVKDGDGNEKTFTISKFDAVFGREIYFQYPLTALPKVGDYPANEDLMFRAMKYVAVTKEDGTLLPLSSKALVINHITDWEMQIAIEKELGVYNFSFFRDGRALTFFDGVAQIFIAKITEILTPSSDSSFPAGEQPTKN